MEYVFNRPNNTPESTNKNVRTRDAATWPMSWLYNYVDADRITPWNLTKALAINRFWDIFKGMVFVVAFSALSNNYYQKYNQAMNDFQNQVNDITVSVVKDSENGKISKADAKRLQEQAKTKKFSTGSDLLAGIINLNRKQMYDGLKGVYQIIFYPSSVKSEGDKLQEEYKKTLSINTILKSNLEGCLAKLESNYPDNIDACINSFNLYKQSGLPVGSYEEIFDQLGEKYQRQLEIKHQREIKQQQQKAAAKKRADMINQENAYYDNLSNTLMQEINQRCGNGCDEKEKNAVAIQVGIYFKNHIKPVKYIDLGKKTKQISAKVSKNLGYAVDLTNYLP